MSYVKDAHPTNAGILLFKLDSKSNSRNNVQHATPHYAYRFARTSIDVAFTYASLQKY